MTITIADGRGALWQWDTGRKVKITDGVGVKQIHYQNRCFGCSVDVDVGADGTAIIPDELLQDWRPLTAYAYVTDDTGAYTMVQQDFIVHKRARPSDYVYTPADHAGFDRLRAEIGDLADLTTEAKENLVAAINEAAASGGADWAQNDAAAADYVRNRPGGYYDDPVETEVEIYSGELSASVDSIEEPPFTLVAGDTYRVKIDGTAQEYVAFADEIEKTPCVTIGTAAFAEAVESKNAWAITYAEITRGSNTSRVALTTGSGDYNKKTFALLETKLTRQVHKIPLELLETPPVKEQFFMVTVGEKSGDYYASSATLDEIKQAVQNGMTVKLGYNGFYYDLTRLEDENAYFHGFNQFELLWAVHGSHSMQLFTYNIGKNELTYDVSNTYTSLGTLNAFSQTFSTMSTRMKFFMTIRLLSTTAGAYVQMRYYKGTKTLNLCKHEDIGTNKVILYGELERTEANDTTFITTLRLLNETGTPHDSGFYFCGELDLDSGESYVGPKIEIVSGTDDKFASKQSMKTYYR